MRDEEWARKRKELDVAYSELNELYRRVSEAEAKVERLRAELGVEI